MSTSCFIKHKILFWIMCHFFQILILWKTQLILISPATLGFAYDSEINDYKVVKISTSVLPLGCGWGVHIKFGFMENG